MFSTSQDCVIHQLIEQQVAQTPDAVAVMFADQHLSYRQLNQRANQLAHYLVSLGVKPDVLVGVCLERSLEMIIALLAILKAGGAYLPLDMSYPTDRLGLMLEDAQAPIVLTQTQFKAQLPNGQSTLICLDTSQETIQGFNANEAPEAHVTPGHLAYVIYTSGSTGRPKGVAMPQAPLVNLLHWQQEVLPVMAGTRTLQFTPISFDVSFQEIFSTLIGGGTLVLIQDCQRRDPSQLLEFLQSQQVHRLFLPFVALRQLAEMAVRSGLIPGALQDVITAGEQLRITDEIMQWFERMPNCRLHNHYGPSESHVVTAYTLSGATDTWPTLPAIGKPILNSQIHILDAELNPIPPEMTGELYIGGACLAREYLHRPDLTAERFILHSLNTNTIIRLYRTGDLARYLPDGNIEYRGRADQQIKIRGYRIEPGEIETTLEHHPQVRSAIVIARDAQPDDRRFSPLGEKRLVAYIVPEVPAITGGTFEAPFARVLRQYLKQHLPEYMIPSAFVVMDAFPLTPSGKVDRRALPLPKWTRIEEGNFIEPRTPIETQIAQLWQACLSIERIGVHDNFFELGGHSLLAVEVVVAIEQAFQVQVGLEAFIAAPTIIGLANAITARLECTSGGICSQDCNADTSYGELDSTIYPEYELQGPLPSIFLTGATGTLGISLLNKLLANSRADVYCLVRATRVEEAMAKIQRSMSRYQLWDESFAHRIFPVLGDLSQPQLGLEDPVFARLAEKIDIIYHCGAWVNIIYPLSVLKATNVNSTEEILRLASRTKVKPVHYISTIDVFSSLNDPDEGGICAIRRDCIAGPLNHLYSGYAQSKLLAEKLLQTASERGVPVSIYRPSNIIGHHRSGIWDPKSFIAMFIKGCLQMGLAPQMDAQLNLVTMDYVSKAILNLAQTQIPHGKSYLMVNPHPLSWGTLLKWIGETGYPLTLAPYEVWYSQLLKLSTTSSATILSPLVSYLANPGFVQKLLGTFTFDCQDTTEILAQQSLYCPVIDQQFMTAYFTYFVETGYWSVPPATTLTPPRRIANSTH